MVLNGLVPRSWWKGREGGGRAIKKKGYD